MSSGADGGPTPMVDLENAARRITNLLDELPDDRLGAPTPSTIPVAGLLSHLLMLSEAFRVAATKEAEVGPPPAAPPSLDPRWRTLLPQRLDALVAAWREPGAQEGTTSAGGLTMPAAETAVVALDELVLHGWDLARATGQPYEPDGADVAAVLAFTSAFGSPEGTPGLFGPAVPVPDDAPDFDRALGFSGRDPAWRAPAPTR
jgi:uncharacterized protein (TIGR03086 family)